MKQIILAIALIAASAFAVAEEYYTWQDEEGIRHYSKIPPEGYKSERVTINAPRPSSTTVVDDGAKEEEKTSESDKKAEYCQQIKDNLAILNKYKTAKTKDADGKERMLTAEEMQTRKQEMLDLQKQHCTE